MPKIITPHSYHREIEREVQSWVDSCLGVNPTYDDSLQPTIDQWGLPWFRAGVLVVNRKNQFLLMHEARVQVGRIRDEERREELLAAGHKSRDWVNGDGGWNLPAGRLRIGENFEGAALREAKEETGWTIVIERFLYARHSEAPDNRYIMPVYWAMPVSGPLSYSTPETSEINWFTAEQIHNMAAEKQLRSPDFVLESLKVYQDNPSIY